MAKSPPELSIVVPTFNADLYLEAALKSIRMQAASDYELIIVDDGSYHSQEAMARSIFPDVIYIRQDNRGPAASRNFAIRRSRGNRVAFLDADDLWTEKALAGMLKGFLDAPSVDCVQGSIKRFFETENQAGRAVLGPAYFSFNVGALMVRKQILERVGGFDELLRQSEDVDLHIRMKESGVRKLTIPDVLLLYRRHNNALNETELPPILLKGHQGSWLRLLHTSMDRRKRAGVIRADPAVRFSPDITVAIVVQNGRKYLPSVLSSIREQTVAASEILAVVGRSSDGTREYLETQPDVKVLEQSGTGLAAARNKAVQAARCNLIAFHDADDIWHPKKLAAQLEALSLTPGPAFCITNFSYVQNSTDDFAKTKQSTRRVRIGFTPSALLAHRTVFNMLGEFDTELGSGCDSDWFFRARESAIPCAVASQVLMYKLIYDDNLSHDMKTNRRHVFQIIRKSRTTNRRPLMELPRD